MNKIFWETSLGKCSAALFYFWYRNKLGGSLGTRLTGNTKKKEHPEIEMQLMSGKLTWFQELSSKGHEIRFIRELSHVCPTT